MYSLRKLSFAQTNLLDQLFVLKKEQQIKKTSKDVESSKETQINFEPGMHCTVGRHLPSTPQVEGFDISLCSSSQLTSAWVPLRNTPLSRSFWFA